jgi:hypothetical protein
MHARLLSQRVVCQTSQRNLMQSALFYADANDQILPFANSVMLEYVGMGGERWEGAGWLYRAPAEGPVASMLDEMSDDAVQTFMRSGVLWRYINDQSVYRCPVDAGPDPSHSTQRMSSYLMNAAVNGYGQQLPAWKISEMPSQAIAFWEVAPSEEGWREGCAYPTDGLALRHGGGNVVSFDTHTEWWSTEQFARQSRVGPNRLWCNPANTSTGGPGGNLRIR